MNQKKVKWVPVPIETDVRWVKCGFFEVSETGIIRTVAPVKETEREPRRISPDLLEYILMHLDSAQKAMVKSKASQGQTVYSNALEKKTAELLACGIDRTIATGLAEAVLKKLAA